MPCRNHGDPVGVNAISLFSVLGMGGAAGKFAECDGSVALEGLKTQRATNSRELRLKHVQPPAHATQSPPRSPNVVQPQL